MMTIQKRAGSWLRRRAENVAAAMLAVMFLAFLVQIVFRYLLNWPSGWATETSTIMWVWLVLWGAAFIVREQDEVRFDIFFSGARPKVRRTMIIITAAAIVTLYLMSLSAVWDYVTFMRVQRTAYLGIRYDWLYSIYVLFAVAIVCRYLWLGVRAILGDVPDHADPDTDQNGG
ncbi:MAG: TRAP transporter small permease subunit [Paracoccaceae bacterium]|nr:TRAP transporter small permease subunit [Paracoccaceae bacterium]